MPERGDRASAHAGATPHALVVLPAYDEAARIERVLDRAHDVLSGARVEHRIVIVDDGSRDGTWEILQRCAERLPLDLVRHPANAGLGVALRDGLRTALARAADGDVIVTMDADDTHDPQLIPDMMKRIAEGADVVVASRYEAGAEVRGVPLARRLSSRAASVLFRAVFPTPRLSDYTSGYRAYAARALSRAARTLGDRFVDQVGFQCQVDLLLELRQLDFVFEEVPIVLHYDLKESTSKMRTLRTAVATLALLAEHRFGRR